MTDVIVIDKLTKSFKGKTVLEDVNMRLQEGRIYGIVGDNGSGKTVLLKLICGLNVNPDRVLGSLISERCQSLLPNMQGEQLSLFDNRITREDVVQCLHGQM